MPGKLIFDGTNLPGHRVADSIVNGFISCCRKELPILGFSTSQAIEFAIGRPVISFSASFESFAALGTGAGITDR